MKYRNNATNIGVLVGFATNLPDGRVRIQQRCDAGSPFIFDRAEGVRPADYDYELVLVIYQLHPQPDGVMPKLVATHITRASKALLPKDLKWMAQDWPKNTDFYPFGPKYGTFKQEIMDAAPDTLDLPAWFVAASAEDYDLKSLLPDVRVKALVNRFLLTGQVIKRGHGVGKGEADYLKLQVRQPGDKDYIPVRLLTGLQGYSTFLNNKYPPKGLPSTIVGRLFYNVYAHNEIEATEFEYFIASMNILGIGEFDVAPGVDTAHVLMNHRYEKELFSAAERSVD